MKFKFTRLMIISLFIFSASAQAVTIKIATLSPDGTTWMKKMRAAAKEITTQTNNRVKIKFYPGGVMGNENAILRKMRINQLQGAAVSSQSSVVNSSCRMHGQWTTDHGPRTIGSTCLYGSTARPSGKPHSYMPRQ